MSRFEDELGRSLQDRADGLGGDQHPVTLGDVQGAAKRMRRRRTAGSALAAAAVVAVAIGVTTYVVGQQDQAPDVAGSPTPSPSATGSPTASPTPSDTPSQAPESPAAAKQVVLTTNVESHGGEPGIPYLFQGAINLPDGSQLPVQQDYRALAKWGAGFAAVRYDDKGNAFVDFLDSTGKRFGSDESTGAIAVSPDGQVLGWAHPDGLIQAYPWDREAVQVSDSTNTLPNPLVAGVLGSAPCGPSEGESCAVYYTNGEGGAFVATTSGQFGELGDLVEVADVSREGLVSGLVSASDQGSCSAVQDHDGRQLWKTCDYTVTRFSDDGKYVLGLPPYLDGLGSASLAILDAQTGEPVVVFRAPNGSNTFVYDAQWDTDGTVLATVYGQGGYALMRMSPDGQLSNVSACGLADGRDPTQVPLILPTRP